MAHRFIFMVLAFGIAGCRAQIQHGLDERDANEIVSMLTSRGFEADKVAEKAKKPSWAIEVDGERAAEALRVLSDLKLPRPQRTTTRDVAAQSGLIDTPGAEKLRQLEALEGDIEQTLETLDGVVSAGVELVVPMAPRPGQTPAPSKASALLRVLPDNLERIQQQREQLKSLIAGSVEGLKADDVSLVVDAVTNRVAAPPPEDSSWRLRGMVVVLAVLLTAVAGVLVAMTLQLRRMARAQRTAPAPAGRSTPAATPAQATTRPVIAAAAARKVA